MPLPFLLRNWFSLASFAKISVVTLCLRLGEIEPELGNDELLSSSTIIVLGVIHQDIIVSLEERTVTVHALPVQISALLSSQD